MLVTAGEIVMKHYDGNPDEWQAVIKAIYMLVPNTDSMDNILGYCNCEEYGLCEDDRDGVINLIIVLDANNKDKDGHDNNSDSRCSGRYVNMTTRAWCVAHEEYLAKQMWEGYKEWLNLHLDELDWFKQFEVSSFCPCNTDV
jgi:hypothetical protein